MDKHIYSNTFFLAFKDKYIEPPVGFHPVYIKQKRVQCTSKHPQQNNGEGRSIGSLGVTGASAGGGGKWDNLEKIRAFTSTENSFIQRTRNRTSSEVLIGEVRSLLNKVTDKTYDAIVTSLEKMDYTQFDDDMIDQTIKVYISKAIADKDYGELYAQLGGIFNSKFKTFKSELTKECVEMLEKLINAPAINEIYKSKCLGLMRALPYLLEERILDSKIINAKIITVICARINERKNTNESYAQIAATGGCGMYIELLCKFCEQLPKCNTSRFEGEIKIDGLVGLLDEIKSIKSIQSRVRFMIEDTLELLTPK